MSLQAILFFIHVNSAETQAAVSILRFLVGIEH